MGFDEFETEIADDSGQPNVNQYPDGNTSAGTLGISILGKFGALLRQIAVDDDGHLQIDVLSGAGGGTLVTDNQAIVGSETAVIMAGTDGSNFQHLSTDADGHMQTDVLSLPSLPSGSNNIGIVESNLRDGAGTPLTSTLIDTKQSLDVNVKQEDGAELTTTLSENNLTAFGEVLTAQLTPKIHVQFAYNINSEQISTFLAGSGTVTSVNGMAEIHSGAASSSSARMETKDVIKYNTGVGGLARFTALFTTGVVGNTQWAGAGNDTNGFFIGFNGTDFAINRKYNSTDNIVTQSNFNVDKLDGTGPSGMTIDPTKGNVYQIRYQWLGFGQITYYVEDPLTGFYQAFHRIQYANANIQTSVLNPTFPIEFESKNTTNTSDVVIKAGSVAGFVEGIEGSIGIRQSKSSLKTGVTTEVNILTIRNKLTFQSIENLVRVKLDFISASNSGNKSTEYRIIRNGTLGGTPSFTDIDTSTSVVETDVSGTTITGGVELLSLDIAENDSQNLLLSELEIELQPGDQITISAASESTATVRTSISWKELF